MRNPPTLIKIPFICVLALMCSGMLLTPVLLFMKWKPDNSLNHHEPFLLQSVSFSGHRLLFFYYSGIMLVLNGSYYAVRSKLVWQFRMTETGVFTTNSATIGLLWCRNFHLCHSLRFKNGRRLRVTIRVLIKTRKG